MLRNSQDASRNNAFSLYDLYGHTLTQEHLSWGVMKFTNLVDPSLIIISMRYIQFVWSMPGNREDDY